MANFRSLKKPLLSQEVERQLKKAITDGTFMPGEKLPTELELCDQFQVSRVTIREALKTLKTSGLIEIKRGMNAGAYVCEFTADAITESFFNLIHMGRVNYGHLIDARMYLEPNTARSVALTADTKDLDQLKDLLDKAEKMVPVSCREARLINVSFHCEVAKISDNPIIHFITESVTQAYSGMLIKETSEELDQKGVLALIKQHREILNAIRERDPEKAYNLTRDHLQHAKDMYRRFVLENNQSNQSDTISN